MGHHPGKHELLAYAENLVDRRAPISAKIGGHITSCRSCTAEVEAIRASLEYVREAPALEPSAEFTSQVLMAAHNERRATQLHRTRRSPLRVIFKGMAYAAGILVVSAVCFSAALSNGQMDRDVQAAAVQRATDAIPSPEAVRRATEEIQALASAVNSPSKNPPSLQELERRRTVSALSADIEAARAALERNPGCLRAYRLMDTNLQRQAQTLKALYIERSL